MALAAGPCEAGKVTDLNNAHIVIFGASGGLGRALSEQLLQAGARLSLSARSAGRLADLAPTGATLLPAELTRPGAAEAVLTAAQASCGPITGVIFAAGVVAFGPIIELDDDVLDELLLINLIAPIRVLRSALPLLPPDGFLAAISGVVAERAMPQLAAYSATKAGLAAALAAAAVEARRQKVRVIDIRPPHTETGLATHPLAGQAPSMPPGLSPESVARRIILALQSGERELPAAAFN